MMEGEALLALVDRYLAWQEKAAKAVKSKMIDDALRGLDLLTKEADLKEVKNPEPVPVIIKQEPGVVVSPTQAPIAEDAAAGSSYTGSAQVPGPSKSCSDR